MAFGCECARRLYCVVWFLLHRVLRWHAGLVFEKVTTQDGNFRYIGPKVSETT